MADNTPANIAADDAPPYGWDAKKLTEKQRAGLQTVVKNLQQLVSLCPAGIVELDAVEFIRQHLIGGGPDRLNSVANLFRRGNIDGRIPEPERISEKQFAALKKRNELPLDHWGRGTQHIVDYPGTIVWSCLRFAQTLAGYPDKEFFGDHGKFPKLSVGEIENYSFQKLKELAASLAKAIGKSSPIATEAGPIHGVTVADIKAMQTQLKGKFKGKSSKWIMDQRGCNRGIWNLVLRVLQQLGEFEHFERRKKMIPEIEIKVKAIIDGFRLAEKDSS